MAAAGYEVLEHPADIGFRAHAPTLPRLFEQSAVALLSIAADPAAAEPRTEFPLSAEGGGLEPLLVAWLSEVLFWFDSGRAAFREFHIRELSDTALVAAGLGEPRDPSRHRSRLIVKAVTWHQLKIERRGDVWTAQVYLDI